jgi:formylglycine-generating enzyme required for sulfatase activity
MRRSTAMAICTVAALWPSATGAQTPSRDEILQRAGLYVSRFIQQFSDVVADEHYVQDSLGTLPVSITTGRGGGALAAPPPQSRHREVKSDFLLVKIGAAEWLPFRDVYEVDGQKIRDREGRLAKLFLQRSSSSMEQARQISAESSRYNLGAMQRTINTPILALLYLQLEVQPNFRFTMSKNDVDVGEHVWILDYKETGRPTLVRGARNTDIPSSGRFWIDADSGRVVKTELALDTPGIHARLTTTFRKDEKFQIDVPFEMSERYALDRGTVTAVASYSRFRRFDVSSDEAFQTPKDTQLTLTDHKTGMTLVEVASGRFTIGSASSELGRGDDEASHDVTLNRPFFLGKNEVTQQEWRAVMGANPSRFADCGPRCPVENVSYTEVQQFLAALNTQPDKQIVYRLPTESEWEYACRAGTVTPFFAGDVITTTQANYNGKEPYGKTPAGQFRQKPTRAGGFPGNAWGFQDMHGNVAEWTSDWYGPYAGEDVTDPTGPQSGEGRVVRGGSWKSSAAAARCAARSSRDPNARDNSIGFRVAGDRITAPNATP